MLQVVASSSHSRICGLKVLIVGLREINHELLCALRKLPTKKTGASRKNGKCRNSGLWGQDSVISDHAAVLKHTATTNDTVLADIYEGAHMCSVYDAVLVDKHMVANLKWEESNPLAELLERRPNDRLAADDTVTANPHVGQVATNYGFRLDDSLSVENDVVTSTQNRISAHFVPRSSFDVILLVVPNVHDVHTDSQFETKMQDRDLCVWRCFIL